MLVWSRGANWVSRALNPKLAPILSVRGAKTTASNKRTAQSSGRIHSKNDKIFSRKKGDPVERRLTAYYKNYPATGKTKAPVKSPTAKPKPKPKPEEKPDIEVVRSRTPSVYICPPLDPELVDYSQWAKKAEYLFSLPKEYVHPSTIGYELPTDERPEFAFIGRSNVGKSSLIGALLGSKGLVKVSKEPGI